MAPPDNPKVSAKNLAPTISVTTDHLCAESWSAYINHLVARYRQKWPNWPLFPARLAAAYLRVLGGIFSLLEMH